MPMPMAEAGGTENRERNKSNVASLRERMISRFGLGEKFNFEFKGFGIGGNDEDGAETVVKAPEIRGKGIGMFNGYITCLARPHFYLSTHFILAKVLIWSLIFV